MDSQEAVQYPIVSVVIPCRNEIKHICECIDAILAQEDFDVSVIEIIVVDADSNDGSADAVRKTYGDRVTLLRNEKIFTPYAFNKGIKNASGEYIIIIGPRNIMSSNYIASAIQVLQQNKEIGCTGGYAKNVFENARSESIAAAMTSKVGVGFSNFRTVTQSGYVDTVGTPVFRRSVFQEIGFFDERLVRNQDDDFSFRLVKAGYKIWLNAGIYMRYYVRTSFKNLFRQYFQYGYWKVFVNRKHRTITTARQVVPAMFVLFLLVGLPLFYILHVPLLYTGILLFYILVVIAAAFVAGEKKSGVLVTAYSIFILHLSYGLGYLKGILDFILLSRGPSEQAKELTR